MVRQASGIAFLSGHHTNDYFWVMFSLQRKIAAITGGGSGIGKAIAELFASQGADVFILELNMQPAKRP